MTRKAVWLLFLIFTASSALLCSGCLSQMLGREAGGNLIWWCDRCQQRVGHPDTHICGLTKYDPQTKRDVARRGVTKAEIDEALRERRAQDLENDSVRSFDNPVKQDEKKSWLYQETTVEKQKTRTKKSTSTHWWNRSSDKKKTSTSVKRNEASPWWKFWSK